MFPRAADGSYLVLEVLTADLTSTAGTSVGACNLGSNNGNTIGAGVRVHAVVRDVYVIRNGTLDPSAGCTSFCFIGKFATTVFGPNASAQALSDLEDYQSQCNGRWLGAFAPDGSIVYAAGDITGPLRDC